LIGHECEKKLDVFWENSNMPGIVARLVARSPTLNPQKYNGNGGIIGKTVKVKVSVSDCANITHTNKSLSLQDTLIKKRVGKFGRKE
jgi:hypothetical protein